MHRQQCLRLMSDFLRSKPIEHRASSLEHHPSGNSPAIPTHSHSFPPAGFPSLAQGTAGSSTPGNKQDGVEESQRTNSHCGLRCWSHPSRPPDASGSARPGTSSLLSSLFLSAQTRVADVACGQLNRLGLHHLAIPRLPCHAAPSRASCPGRPGHWPQPRAILSSLTTGCAG